MGFRRLHLPRVRARLLSEFQHRSGREHYQPARASLEDGGFVVEALPTHGSADLVAFSRSNSFLVVSQEVDRLPADSDVQVVLRSEYWHA